MALNQYPEDFNFPEVFDGIDQVSDFLDEFDIPGITFVPERFSDGTEAVCFIWYIEIAGVDAAPIRGVSFYRTRLEADGSRRVSYVRDIPEPALKPPPLLALATLLRPGIRRFTPLPVPVEKA
jgi:hypothetical protein